MVAAAAVSLTLAAATPARAYALATERLGAAVTAWGGHGPLPPRVAGAALAQERLLRRLARSPRLAAQVPAARDETTALRDLFELARPYPARKRVVAGMPPPPLALLRWYREAQRRFGVGWNVLAAVNLVESGFGKLRNDSLAGAQGPMQFMPATWAAYRLGGDVHDPHAAILGAANYLHVNGAPARLWDALYHYNPSPLYVDAVLRFARRIGRGTDSFLAFYAWPVFVRTTAGERVVG